MQGWFHGYRDTLVKYRLTREGFRHRAGRPDRSALHVFRQAALSSSLPSEIQQSREAGVPRGSIVSARGSLYWISDGPHGVRQFCSAHFARKSCKVERKKGEQYGRE